MNIYIWIYLVMRGAIICFMVLRSIYLWMNLQELKHEIVKNQGWSDRIFRIQMAFTGSMITLLVTLVMESVTMCLLYLAGLFDK